MGFLPNPDHPTAALRPHTAHRQYPMYHDTRPLASPSTTLPMPKALTLAILLHTPGIPRSTHLITFRIS